MIDAQKHAALTAALAKGRGKHLGIKKQLNIEIPRNPAKEKRAAEFDKSVRGKIGGAIQRAGAVDRNIMGLAKNLLGRRSRKKALITARTRAPKPVADVGMPRVRRALQGGDAQKAL